MNRTWELLVESHGVEWDMTLEVDVDYTARRGYPATWDQPAEPGEVEVTGLRVTAADASEAPEAARQYVAAMVGRTFSGVDDLFPHTWDVDGLPDDETLLDDVAEWHAENS